MVLGNAKLMEQNNSKTPDDLTAKIVAEQKLGKQCILYFGRQSGFGLCK
jgi:hypothetical protein